MEFAGKQQAAAKSGAPGADAAALCRPLQECGEIAVPRLSGALSDALRLAADQLFTQSTHARTPLEREALLDASAFAQARRQGLVDDFRRHFEQRYARACRRAPERTGEGAVLGPAQMRIVEHDRLEDVLDPHMLTEAIQHANWTALAELAKWFRTWLQAPALTPHDLPLGPRLIGEAVSDTLRDQFWRHEAKQRLLQLLARHLPERVGGLYRDLARHLNASAVTPAAAVAVWEIGAPPLPAGGLEMAAALPEPAAPSVTIPTAVQPVPPSAADVAAVAARDEVGRQLAGKALPALIVDFLTGPWQARLAQLHAVHGAASPAWTDAVDTMDALVRTLSGAAPADGRGPGLPALMQRLRLGLEALGTPIEMRNRFFIGLAQCHAQAVASSRAPAAAPQAVARPAPAGTGGAAAGQAPAAVQVPAAPLPAASDPVDASLAQLETGDWMVLLEPDGSTRELKLAWISTQRGLFLWTDRQGARARPLGAEELTGLLKEGRARIVRPPVKSKTKGGSAAAPRYQKTA